VAINSLKGVKYIDGHKVMTNDERPLDSEGNVDWEAFDEMRNEYPICIDHEKDMISIKMMTEPVSKGGSGAQLTTLVTAGSMILKYLNNKFSCRENSITATKWEEGLMWQEKRTKDREARNVEGENKL
jgi:hypothetical protein